VSDIPGTTRDRRECLGRIGDTTFRLIDTAGIDGSRIHNGTKDTVTSQMMNQTWQAAQHADLILLVLDARVGVTTDWIETARWLRKASSGHKVLVVANKLEGDSWDYDGSPILENLMEVSRVGFGPAVAVSALHGEGFAELAIKIQELQAAKRREMGLPENRNDIDDDVLNDDKPLQLAILGRQNVGKVSNSQNGLCFLLYHVSRVHHCL
jgi:GTPase